jgi:predicted DNA-binding antitoxin AbrB/MazE fold protein
MKTIKAEPRQGDKVAVIIRVDSTVQEEIILTAKEGMKLASEILNALPNAPIRS